MVFGIVMNPLGKIASYNFKKILFCAVIEKKTLKLL